MQTEGLQLYRQFLKLRHKIPSPAQSKYKELIRESFVIQREYLMQRNTLYNTNKRNESTTMDQKREEFIKQGKEHLLVLQKICHLDPSLLQILDKSFYDPNLLQNKKS